MRTFFKWDEPSRVDTALEAEQSAEAIWRKVCKAVDARDKRACRACGRKSDPEAVGLTKRGHRHHLVYRSAGGADVPSNLVTLCASCHNDEHRHRLRIDGTDADDGLTFWRMDDDGVEYLSRRELAPGVVEKD